MRGQCGSSQWLYSDTSEMKRGIYLIKFFDRNGEQIDPPLIRHELIESVGNAIDSVLKIHNLDTFADEFKLPAQGAVLKLFDEYFV